MNALLGIASDLLGFLGGIGPLELAVIAGLGVLIFGHRLPKVARSLGRGITEFKKGLKEVRDDADVSEDVKQAGEEDKEAEDDRDRPRRRERDQEERRTRRLSRRRREKDDE